MNQRSLLHAVSLVLCSPIVLWLHGAEPDYEFFETKIRPVLVRHCYECHSSALAEPKGGLQLDSRSGIRAGGETGPAVVPGEVEKSLLIAAIRHESLEMPPQEKLPSAVIADFEQWIASGAPDSRDTPPDPAAAARELWEAQFAKRREWWSLQPVVAPPIPSVVNSDWSDQPIDRFILAQLEAHELGPAPPADRETLRRRLSFVLTGLPPRESQKLESEFPQLVDELLNSPHFGEHWARHWMDVVRYTDTYGYEWDIPAKGAWRYRDYLIRAFNADVPFDQLLREQIAGDLLEAPRLNTEEQINESLIGTMFFQMGEKRHGDSSEFNGIHQEMLDNKIDAFSKAFQALTISCARCHDHKLDAVSQREYYALAGTFMSSRWVTNTVDLPPRNAAVLRELASLKDEMRPVVARMWLDDVARFSSATWESLAKDKADWPVEDPLHIWKQLAAAQADGSLPSAWNELAASYSAERRRRQQENAAHFRVVADFRQGIPEGWSVDGVGLRNIVACGDFSVMLEGEDAIGRILPGGLFTNSFSPRLNGAVRTPYLHQFQNGHISFEVCGGDFAAQRIVFDNAFLTEKQTYLSQIDPLWALSSTQKGQGDRRVYIELATKTSNPNFPPRVGLGGACTEEQAADPRSWFGITRVVVHEAPFTPFDELSRFPNLLEQPAPATLDAAAQCFTRWLASAVQAWADQRATADEVWLINWMLDRKVLTNRHDAAFEPRLSGLVNRYRAVERQIALPWTVNGMRDADPGYDYRLNVRGDYDQLGDAVPRGYVRCLCEQLGVAPQRANADSYTASGRRELAEYIASADNPLTARVFVNRVWQHLFGRGLVATSNDFGHLGELPSHPELLDYLASRFVAQGWSLKKLVREIVLTKTWQQSGATTAAAQIGDPSNRWLHHYPLRRLEAESIRDALLAASGRLDPTLFGPPINPPRANEDPQKRLFSGPVDGLGRRSIYTKITIMEPPRFLALFNQPVPKIPTGQRDVTNTPAQSLVLLNDPLVVSQAKAWAESLVQQSQLSTTERLTRMFETAFSRSPTDSELRRWETAVSEFASSRDVPESDRLANIPVWQDVAHALFNTKEFIYVR